MLDQSALQLIQARATSGTQILDQVAALRDPLDTNLRQTCADVRTISQALLEERRASSEKDIIIGSLQNAVREARQSSDEYKALWGSRGSEILELRSEIEHLTNEHQNLRKKMLDHALSLKRAGAPETVIKAAEEVLQR